MGFKTESRARHDVHQNLRGRQSNQIKLKKVIKTSYCYRVSYSPFLFFSSEIEHPSRQSKVWYLADLQCFPSFQISNQNLSSQVRLLAFKIFKASGYQNNHRFFDVSQNVPLKQLSDSVIIFTEHYSPINKSKPSTKGILKDTFNY